MCTSSPPTGPSAVRARHVKERQPSRETVTVVRLARHPATRHGVRSALPDPPIQPPGLPASHPVRPFTARSEPLLPYACCGCTCQQPHAGPGWALTPLEGPPPAQPASPAQTQLKPSWAWGAQHSTLNLGPPISAPCSRAISIVVESTWGILGASTAAGTLLTTPIRSVTACPPFSSPTRPRVVCCACTCTFPSS